MKTRPARRRLRGIGLLALGLAALAGCAKRVGPAEPPPAKTDINILIWNGYFSDDLLARFTKEHGIVVHPTYFSSNEQLYAILKGYDPIHQGPFDLAMPSAFMAKRLLEEGMLAPFQRGSDNKFTVLTKLNPPSNFERPGERLQSENLDKRYNTKFDPNNNYVIPYIWGSTGIGYNAEQVASLPMTWSSFFVPDPRRHIALINDARFTLGSALIYLIAKRYDRNAQIQSGQILSSQEISADIARDFANATPADIERAGEVVKALGREVVCITSDYIPRALASGKADMALAWSGDVAVAMLRGEVDTPQGEPPVEPNLNIRLSLPIEGCIVFRDCFVIPRARRNQRAAEEFIDYLFDPEVAGAVTNFSCYATTVESDAAIIEPEIADGPAFLVHPYRNRNLYLEDSNAQLTDEIYASVWNDVTKSFPPEVFQWGRPDAPTAAAKP